MTSRTIFYTIVTWIMFVLAGVGNEWLNAALASPELNEYGGHVFSVFRLFAFVVVVIYIFVERLEIRRYSLADLLFIGIVWFGLSFASDIVHKHYVGRQSWDMVILEYNIMEGRIKASVLLAELFAPFLFGARRRWLRLRRSRQNAIIKASQSSSN